MNVKADELGILSPGVGVLAADLDVVLPGAPLVVFAHGSGSSRHSPRNQSVARRLQDAGLNTLLLDLLTPAEEAEEQRGARLRFDVDRMARRLDDALDWVKTSLQPSPVSVGLFGASTGAAAALIAATHNSEIVGAIVSRGGRPDLAPAALPHVVAPTLLIVGGSDPLVLELNERAYCALRCERRLEIVPGATHLFEEPGALEHVALHAAQWFNRWLGGGGKE